MECRMTENGRSMVKRLEGEVAFEGTYDVAIIGLGTTGAVAFGTAIAEGLSVIGIERYNAMGGLSTIGIVCFGGGLNQRLLEYERNAEKGKAEYESVIVAIYTEGTRIVGFRYCKNGIAHGVRIRQMIDSTGNATVARMAGLKIRKGRPIDNVMGACARGETWVDNGSKAPRPIYANRPFDLTLTAKDYSERVSFFSQWRHENWKSQRKTARMVRPSMMIGAREECRATTEETATLADAIAEKVFPNPIFYASEPEDLPVFYGDYAFESEEIRNWQVHCGLPMFRFPSSVPYGTIVAKGIDNLFVPSKHFGVSHDLGGSLRMQPEMMKTGKAAVFAAKIAIEKGFRGKDVPYAELKPKFAKAGLFWKRPNSERMDVYHGKSFEPFGDEEVVKWLRQDITRTAQWWQGEIGKAKGTPAECGAYALWTAWKRGVSGTEAERKALSDRLAAQMSEDERYAGNFALALALMKDSRALPVLREIVNNPGCAKDPAVKNAFPNRIKALDMIRRFRDRESAPRLRDIVKDGARRYVEGLVRAQGFRKEEDARFQALSYAMFALRDMGVAIPEADLNGISDIYRERLGRIKS